MNTLVVRIGSLADDWTSWSKITKQNETVFVKIRLLFFFSNTFVLEKENKSPSLSRQTIDRGSLRIKPAIDYRFTLGIVDETSRPPINDTPSVYYWLFIYGRPGGSVGNLETFWRWDASSNPGAVTRSGIFPHKKK